MKPFKGVDYNDFENNFCGHCNNTKAIEVTDARYRTEDGYLKCVDVTVTNFAFCPYCGRKLG